MRKIKKNAADAEQLNLNVMTCKTRWMILLNFSRKNYEIVIKKVYDDIINFESQKYKVARN